MGGACTSPAQNGCERTVPPSSRTRQRRIDEATMPSADCDLFMRNEGRWMFLDESLLDLEGGCWWLMAREVRGGVAGVRMSLRKCAISGHS